MMKGESVMKHEFLYEKYNNAVNDGFVDFKKMVQPTLENNLKHSLRDYQKEAIGRYIYYRKKQKNHQEPEHILYNMATGSGKTLLMAAIMLEKYRQGERNFIFFVNNDNILTKTRDNFLNEKSNKYLFADKIVIDNQVVTVREVSDFSDTHSNAINIVFTTIQKLHQTLNEPRENFLSYEQFEDVSIVLLADEAHHLNAGLNTNEKKDNTSWTMTVDTILKKAKKASLFEFTATIDLQNKAIANKYQKHLIFKYDLKEFRLDGYSKDVLFHLVDSSIQTRMLQAIIISQFRKKVALKNGIYLKPLIMFKSLKISENKKNQDEFLKMLSSLSYNDISNQRKIAIDGILKKAFEFFDKQNITNEHLISELKDDFRKERLLLIDGKTKTNKLLVELNTLEAPENEIRAIFAVDMLNEGWDVLNLFDIVRLYDTRDGKMTKNGFVPGKTTNAEKQLIGRGARYYPFVVGNEPKFTRKFDDNELNELRVIEQLHYHAANNPRYISELKQVLRESGIYDDEGVIEHELNLKESFKASHTYKNGVVWMNKRLSYQEMLDVKQESLFDTNFIPQTFKVALPTLSSRDINAFDINDKAIYDTNNLINIYVKFGKAIDKHVVRTAINQNKMYTFDNLSKAFVGLDSVNHFIDMLKDIDLIITKAKSDCNKLSQDDKLFIANKLLSYIEKDLIAIEERFYGSEKFEPHLIKDVFDSKILRKYTIKNSSQAEFGISQKDPTKTNIFENIDNFEWYAYDDNFGTDEEKYLVRAVKELISQLKEKWTDIYLLRNEKAVQIFSFEEGRVFEPDFLMFANDKKTGNISWQIFIEPKGCQFVGNDGTFMSGKECWKEQFLQQISEKNETKTLVDNERYKIIGLPFYNHLISENLIKNELKKI